MIIVKLNNYFFTKEDDSSGPFPDCLMVLWYLLKEWLSLLEGLDPFKVYGPDNIPTQFIKETAVEGLQFSDLSNAKYIKYVKYGPSKWLMWKTLPSYKQWKTFIMLSTQN